ASSSCRTPPGCTTRLNINIASTPLFSGNPRWLPGSGLVHRPATGSKFATADLFEWRTASSGLHPVLPTCYSARFVGPQATAQRSESPAAFRLGLRTLRMLPQILLG